MAVRTHYLVLGIEPDADDASVRAAYRRLAREHHPDRTRSSSAVGGSDMPAINEAYRVLSDPGRRALYDRSLGSVTTHRSTGSSPTASSGGGGTAPSGYVGPDLLRPARVPWRSLLVFASVAIVGVLVLAQFGEPDGEVRPDGILRNGDCVEIEPNGDAHEVSCLGEGDLVVRAFVTFDGVCPGLTAPHRDRQGMGVACVELRD